MIYQAFVSEFALVECLHFCIRIDQTSSVDFAGLEWFYLQSGMVRVD